MVSLSYSMPAYYLEDLHCLTTMNTKSKETQETTNAIIESSVLPICKETDIKRLRQLATDYREEYLFLREKYLKITSQDKGDAPDEITRLKQTIRALEQTESAIRTGLQREFDTVIQPDADIIDLVTSVIDHHKEKEQQLLSLELRLREIHLLLNNDPSKIILNAKDGYPKNRPDRELTLLERAQALCKYASDWKRWHGEKEKQLLSLQSDNEKLRKTISFFASVIKSGENWSDECEEALTQSIKEK